MCASLQWHANRGQLSSGERGPRSQCHCGAAELHAAVRLGEEWPAGDPPAVIPDGYERTLDDGFWTCSEGFIEKDVVVDVSLAVASLRQHFISEICSALRAAHDTQKVRHRIPRIPSAHAMLPCHAASGGSVVPTERNRPVGGDRGDRGNRFAAGSPTVDPPEPGWDDDAELQRVNVGLGLQIFH
eukprot:Skav200675  [mRNA]  locus=scaffold1446:17360:21765:+ [translate_table: standard]